MRPASGRPAVWLLRYRPCHRGQHRCACLYRTRCHGSRTGSDRSAAPAKKAEPVLNDTEEYFNNAIKQAVKRGDVDKALKLLDEAERLGSTTACSTFISSVKGKG